MKKSNLTFHIISIGTICILIQSNLMAQEYRPMNLDDGVWLVERYIKETGYEYQAYYTFGDTIFNDTVYKKLYSTLIKLPDEGRIDTTFLNSFICGIAEFDDKTVRFGASETSGSSKLYDFNIEIGDTIYNSPLGGEMFIVVNGIDSVLHCGRYHKRYYQRTGTLPIAVTEGIGYSNGILGIFDMIDGGGEYYTILSSYSEKDNPDCPSCYNTSAFQNTFLETDIYPNPTLGQMRIECHEPISRIKVISLGGDVVYEVQIHGLNSMILDIHSYPPGPYIIFLISENDRISVSTIVKKDS